MRKSSLLAVLAAIFAAAASTTLAETVSTKVLKCHDGDTCTVRLQGRSQRVRLAEIDAPEVDQPYGRAAGARLSNLVVGRTVTLVITDIDRYGRPVATMYLGNRSINVDQVASGMAWVNPRYSHDPKLALLQVKARMTRVGLWSQQGPIPPWEWRRAH
jgi:micrococcal nuclease